MQKRLELLPEEALFLIDRGALLCWEESDIFIPGTHGLEDIRGSPMTVQQAFTDMIGKEGLTLEQYQVFLTVVYASFCSDVFRRYTPT
jgi:tRNA-splicing endonuclease subunit Sen54